MGEVFKLLVLLAVMACCNILGGVYVSVSMDGFKFNWKELVSGIVKAVCVGCMFVGLAYVVETIPSLADTIGVQPKAMIVSAIAIYSGKVAGHISTIFGLKKHADAGVQEETDSVYIDR